MIYPILLQGNDIPPTLYSIMESLVNYDTTEKTKIKDMWSVARTSIFNFTYPLTNNLSREEFEHNILNHYLMRRINCDTVNLFSIMLENKLNEIMPKYNMMWDSLIDWNIFKAGTTTRELSDNTSTDNTHNSNTSATLTASTESSINNVNNIAYSDTPQAQISDIDDNSYISEYTHNTSDNNNSTKQNSTTSDATNSSDNSNSNKKVTESVTKTAENELDLFLKYQSEYLNIWTMIYKDLDCLFYGLV